MISPLVTVVLPTFNRAGTIRPAVDSVLRQTWTDLELIVVDDCSSDDTLATLAKIRDPRLRVGRHTANSGAGAARNTGIRMATGCYVAFHDSDDEWLPLKLEKQLARLEAKDAAYVGAYCGMIVQENYPESRRGTVRARLNYWPSPDLTTVDGEIHAKLLEQSLISTQTLIARRDALAAIGEFDETLPALEDWDYALRLARHGPLAFIDEPLVIQRFSTDSISRSRRNRTLARTRIVEKNLEALSENPKLLAWHHYAIAGEWRRLGEYRLATGQLLQCLRHDPLRLRSYAALAAVSFLGLCRRR